MNKRTFLKTTGILGLSSMVPGSSLRAGGDKQLSTCELIPTETAGPFPLDLTTNNFFFRQDVREDREGVPLRLRMKIVGDVNCEPMPNVRVNIWHCDKDGAYSGYDNAMNPGQAGKTYLRGYQITDSNGELEFVTIFPGWYPGRICHIHFQVFVSSVYSVVSQLAFDEQERNALYSANSNIYTKGPDPQTFATDNVFVDGYTLQVASLEANGDGTYLSTFQATVRGTGTTGVGHIEKENAKHFVLGQNAPNPCRSYTEIPLTLHTDSRVTIELYNLDGRKIHTLVNQYLQAGEHRFAIDGMQLALASGSIAYQVRVENSSGVYTDVKLLAVLRI